MRWYVKINWEDEKYIEFGYSFETNDTCDGEILYERETDTFTIKKMSSGADEYDTKRLYYKALRHYREGNLSEERFIIAIG